MGASGVLEDEAGGLVAEAAGDALAGADERRGVEVVAAERAGRAAVEVGLVGMGAVLETGFFRRRAVAERTALLVLAGVAVGGAEEVFVRRTLGVVVVVQLRVASCKS